jgi:hypothetical protein
MMMINATVCDFLSAFSRNELSSTYLNNTSLFFLLHLCCTFFAMFQAYSLLFFITAFVILLFLSRMWNVLYKVLEALFLLYFILSFLSVFHVPFSFFTLCRAFLYLPPHSYMSVSFLFRLIYSVLFTTEDVWPLYQFVYWPYPIYNSAIFDFSSLNALPLVITHSNV